MPPSACLYKPTHAFLTLPPAADTKIRFTSAGTFGGLRGNPQQGFAIRRDARYVCLDLQLFMLEQINGQRPVVLGSHDRLGPMEALACHTDTGSRDHRAPCWDRAELIAPYLSQGSLGGALLSRDRRASFSALRPDRIRC